jgi:hypothetical protein
MDLSVLKLSNHLIVTVVIGFKEMQQKVNEESALLAIRQRDDKGNTFFDDFVMDEAYETKLRSYFYSAQHELSDALCAYTKYIPEVSTNLNTTKAGDEDYVVQLYMPPNFNESLAKGVAIKMEDFVESYIMYRWLETKLPDRAGVYLERCGGLKSDINGNLNKRAGSIRRGNGYY